MQGLHLTADLRGCPLDAAGDDRAGALRELCLRRGARRPACSPSASCSTASRRRPAQRGDAPAGITGVVLLAESHLAVHTWPELAAATLDVYVCNFGADNSARARSAAGDADRGVRAGAGRAARVAARRSAAEAAIAADEGDHPRRRPRRAHAAADRPHAQAAARGARQAADRMAPRGAGARRACARSSSTPPGSRSRSSPRSATARASASRSLLDGRPRPRRRARDRRRHRQGAAAARRRADDAFWLVSADIYAPDFRFDAARAARFAASDRRWRTCGWCRTRPSTRRGDFGARRRRPRRRRHRPPTASAWTYANIALCRAALFAGIAPGTRAALGAAAVRRRACASAASAPRCYAGAGKTSARPSSSPRSTPA